MDGNAAVSLLTIKFIVVVIDLWYVLCLFRDLESAKGILEQVNHDLRQTKVCIVYYIVVVNNIIVILLLLYVKLLFTIFFFLFSIWMDLCVQENLDESNEFKAKLCDQLQLLVEDANRYYCFLYFLIIAVISQHVLNYVEEDSKS